MRRLTDFAIFTNEIQLKGVRRQARWNNRAVVCAAFYAGAHGQDVEAEQLIEGALTGDSFCVKALVYGALKANNRSYTQALFEREFRPTLLNAYFIQTTAGLAHYLPDEETTAQREADGGETAGASFLNDFAELAVQALHMGREDVLNASPRSISAMLSAFMAEENLKEEYFGDDISWL